MTSPESLVGKQIQQFRIDRYLARGSMGLVFQAFDTVLLRPVALKIIFDDDVPQVGDGGLTGEEARKRLIQEAKAAGRLSHPNVVTIYAYGRAENCHYICMELVSGQTLAEVLRERKRLEVGEALRIGRQVLLALSAAAGEHIVHRDIKPSNIMITPTGDVKVMDFGIAKLPSCASTTAGTILGTPFYMSPEQVMGRTVDVRSDLFSLGTVLYQMLGGTLPFEGESTATITYKILHAAPVPIEEINSSIPRPLAGILAKALRKDPALRYQHPSEMLEDLNLLASPENLAAYSRSDPTEIVERRMPAAKGEPCGDVPGPADSPKTGTRSGESHEAEPDRDQEAAPLPPVPLPEPPVRDVALVAPLPSRPKPGKSRALRNWIATHRRATLGIALALLCTLAAAAAFSGWSLFGYRLDLSRIGWMDPLTGRSTVSGTPDSWSPGPHPAPRIEGRYRVEGISPDGGRYLGTAVIERTGNHYRVSWNLANQMFSGTGTLSGNAFAVTWTGTSAGGTVTYTLYPNGALHGTWAGGRGRETLIPTP